MTREHCKDTPIDEHANLKDFCGVSISFTVSGVAGRLSILETNGIVRWYFEDSYNPKVELLPQIFSNPKFPELYSILKKKFHRKEENNMGTEQDFEWDMMAKRENVLRRARKKLQGTLKKAMFLDESLGEIHPFRLGPNLGPNLLGLGPDLSQRIVYNANFDLEYIEVCITHGKRIRWARGFTSQVEYLNFASELRSQKYRTCQIGGEFLVDSHRLKVCRACARTVAFQNQKNRIERERDDKKVEVEVEVEAEGGDMSDSDGERRMILG